MGDYACFFFGSVPAFDCIPAVSGAPFLAGATALVDY